MSLRECVDASDQRARKAVRLYRNGLSVRRVADELGLGRKAVTGLLERLECHLREPGSTYHMTVCPIEGCDAPCGHDELLHLVRDLGVVQTANLLMINRTTVYHRRRAAMGQIRNRNDRPRKEG